jgi:zinc protease
VGDVDHEQAQELVEKYWGPWEKGTYKAPIPAEPPQSAPQTVQVDFHAPTLPLLAVSYHAPAYGDEVIDSAVLDVIAFQTFGESSDLYKRLVLEQQKVDILSPGYYDHVDPYLFSIIARVKKPEDVADVQAQILEEIEKVKNEAVAATELENVKSFLRYQFALSMDSTSAIAGTLAHYLGLTRDPETINRRYRLYQRVTPQDIQTVAKKVFVDSGRTITTLETAAEGAKSE